MTTKFFSGGALAALAATLAFTAVPASAQVWQHRDRNKAEQSDNRGSDSRARNNGDAPAWGSRNRGDTPQRTNTPAETRSNGQWTGRHEDNRAAAAPRAVNQGLPGWNGNRAWQGNRADVGAGRNTTYVDPNRNTTYRNTDRRDDRRDNDRDWRRDRNNDRDWRGDRRDNDRDWRNDRRGNYGNWSSNNNYQRWDRNWRNNNRYDWQRYRTYNRYAYRLQPYYAPYRDYSYRRLSIGFYMDPLFFGQDYWIGNPGYYRLPDVYGPYRWVRYYDDALLVDIYSGEVVDVIYDFFW